MEQKGTLVRPLLMGSCILVALSLMVQGQQNPPVNPNYTMADRCRDIVVLGAIRTPTRFELRENIHLKELIACAGGLTEKAGRALLVTHAGEGADCLKSEAINRAERSGRDLALPLTDFYALTAIIGGEPGSGPVVRAGDVIWIPEHELVFTIGGVLTPQAINHTETLTLTQAITQAGGVRHGAKTNKIRIIRYTLGSQERTVITVNLKKILEHRAEDILLQPFDIVEVPDGPIHGCPGLLRAVNSAFGSLPLRTTCDDSQFLSAK